jgi:hypothetical protein
MNLHARYRLLEDIDSIRAGFKTPPNVSALQAAFHLLLLLLLLFIFWQQTLGAHQLMGPCSLVSYGDGMRE